VEDAGFEEVRSSLVGDRVIAPAFRFVHARLAQEGSATGEHAVQAFAARTMLREAQLLWDRGILEYLLLTARKPA
jgi:hypothetical protein